MTNEANMPESGSGSPEPLDYASPRHDPPERHPWFFWPVVTLASIFILLLFICLLLPDTNSRGTAPRVMSASNLRQIGQAILLYTNDNHGQYPDSFATILMNEDITSSVFVSPSRNETAADGPTTQAVIAQMNAGGHVSYVYLGNGLSTTIVTPDTIVAYEIPIDATSGSNILFGDGHVEFFGAGPVQKIIRRIRTGRFPVTMPSP
jgi:prepilin-type processing-associated H-X9-DG protein